MSDAYCQSSSIDSEKLTKDPQNLYLSRANRQRLPYEMIRDMALQSSGLLYRKVGVQASNPINPKDSGKKKQKVQPTTIIR